MNASLFWLLLVGVALLSPQQQPAGTPPPDPRKIDEAVQKGIEWLKGAPSPPSHVGKDSDELILWTFIHAGVAESDPKYKELLEHILAAPLQKTYKVALQAMILEEIDRVKHQKRIFHCAQFLVDNMAPNGEWGYGEPTTLPDFPAGTPTGAKKDAATDAGAKKTEGEAKKRGGVVEFYDPDQPRPKPKVLMRVPVKKQRDGKPHDNSNTQYAALGLRACHDAGIILPKDVVEIALKYLHDCQHGDAPDAKGGVATSGGAAPPRGWGYTDKNEKQATGSMTAGAIGSLCIYHYILGNDWKKDPSVNSGIAWLAAHFSVEGNPPSKGGGRQHYYYLYGLERAGMLYDTTRIGSHDWYAEGAAYLLKAQNANGSWHDPQGRETTWDTCFAILFLKRATRALASIDRGAPK